MMIGSIEHHPSYRAAELGALLAGVLPSACPHQVARLVTDMQRHTRMAKRHALTAMYNGRSDTAADRLAAQYHQTAENFTTRLESLGAPKGTTVELGGDPRGPCGWLAIPGMTGDGCGNPGFAIY